MQGEICARLRLLQLHAGFKPAHKIEPVHAWVLEKRLRHLYLRMKDQRNPKFGRAANADAEELGRSDADDGEGFSVQHHFLVHDLGIAFPLVPPIAVTHHRRRGRSRLVVLGRKHPAKQCVDT